MQQKGLTLADYLPRMRESTVAEGPVHEDNPFGISLVGDGEEQSQGAGATQPHTKLPACAESLDELAEKLKALQS